MLLVVYSLPFNKTNKNKLYCVCNTDNHFNCFVLYLYCIYTGRSVRDIFTISVRSNGIQRDV